MTKFASLALAPLMATYDPSGKTSWRKVALFLCAFPVAFLGNILRIDLSLFLARGISEALAEGFFHSFSGVIVFLFGFILLYYLRKALCGPMPGDGPLPSDSS